MKLLFTKVLVFGGLCALFAGTGVVAGAQQSDHHDLSREHLHHPMIRHAHHRLQRLHSAYYHDIMHGDRAAAERAHLRAKAIRERLREHHRDQH